MPDEQLETPAGDWEPTIVEEERKPRRSLWGLAAVIAAVVIAILVILMLLRDCGGPDAGSNDGGTRTIEEVESLDPLAGAVSLWIDEGASVESALSGIDYDSVVDLQNGRYVVQVNEGSEKQIIAALKGRPGVVDAGFVYEQAGAEK